MSDQHTERHPSLDDMIEAARRRTPPPQPHPTSDTEHELELER